MAPASVRLRRAGPADVTALSALAERLFRDTYSADHAGEDIAAYVRDRLAPAALTAELAQPGAAVFLAEAEGELVGYVQLRGGEAPAGVPGRRAAEIGRLYVDQRQFGRGVAALLLACALEEAQAGGADTAWLVVWTENARARRFYEKHGFRRIGSHPFQVGATLYDDDLMVRPL